MKKPLIGITCLVAWQDQRQMQNETYIQAVLQAGGVPVLLPAVADEQVIREHLRLIDGLLVSGGPDLDPSYFGEEPVTELGAVNPLMDSYEMQLVKQALDQNKPILGICRGEQILNVAAGGTLYQDIYRSIKGCLKHRQEAPRYFRSHSISIEPNTRLAKILGCERTNVNTFHHQAVDKVAPNFVASAFAPDGIIEAIESTMHRFAIGVQWHPEGMWNHVHNYAPLFDAFIEAARL